jgi:hypothetical protein
MAGLTKRECTNVNCALRSKEGYVNFGFNQGTMVIRVSYVNFIVDFDTYCALGVQPADVGVATWCLGIALSELYTVGRLGLCGDCGDPFLES